MVMRFKVSAAFVMPGISHSQQRATGPYRINIAGARPHSASLSGFGAPKYMSAGGGVAAFNIVILAPAFMSRKFLIKHFSHH